MENFIEKKVNNKIVKIPKKLIAQYCKTLELTEEQAIQTYLEEERLYYKCRSWKNDSPSKTEWDS